VPGGETARLEAEPELRHLALGGQPPADLERFELSLAGTPMVLEGFLELPHQMRCVVTVAERPPVQEVDDDALRVQPRSPLLLLRRQPEVECPEERRPLLSSMRFHPEPTPTAWLPVRLT